MRFASNQRGEIGLVLIALMVLIIFATGVYVYSNLPERVEDRATPTISASLPVPSPTPTAAYMQGVTNEILLRADFPQLPKPRDLVPLLIKDTRTIDKVIVNKNTSRAYSLQIYINTTRNQSFDFSPITSEWREVNSSSTRCYSDRGYAIPQLGLRVGEGNAGIYFEGIPVDDDGCIRAEKYVVLIEYSKDFYWVQ